MYGPLAFTLGGTTLVLEAGTLDPSEDPPTDSGPIELGPLSGDPDRDRRNVQLLLDTVSEIHQYLEPGAVLPAIVDRVIRLTGAERGLLLLRRQGASGIDMAVTCHNTSRS